MNHSPSRRAVILGVPTACVALPAMGWLLATPALAAEAARTGAIAAFPSQDPALVRDMVGASHARIDRVRELLKQAPRFANAAYDWGFGDWETALGAASHVGNREIAQLLLEAGARANLFTHAMLGHLEVVRATITAMPGIERVKGPHGLTLMHHARQGGDSAAAVVSYLETLPGADVPYQDLSQTAEERQVYVGAYSFGAAPAETFEMQIQKNRGWLGITRREGGFRRLFYQGDHVFHPAGAPEARVACSIANGRCEKITITTPAELCVAVRTS